MTVKGKQAVNDLLIPKLEQLFHGNTAFFAKDSFKILDEISTESPISNQPATEDGFSNAKIAELQTLCLEEITGIMTELSSIEDSNQLIAKLREGSETICAKLKDAFTKTIADLALSEDEDEDNKKQSSTEDGSEKQEEEEAKPAKAGAKKKSSEEESDDEKGEIPFPLKNNSNSPEDNEIQSSTEDSSKKQEEEKAKPAKKAPPAKDAAKKESSEEKIEPLAMPQEDSGKDSTASTGANSHKEASKGRNLTITEDDNDENVITGTRRGRKQTTPTEDVDKGKVLDKENELSNKPTTSSRVLEPPKSKSSFELIEHFFIINDNSDLFFYNLNCSTSQNTKSGHFVVDFVVDGTSRNI